LYFDGYDFSKGFYLIYLLEVLERRRMGERMAPFHAERIDFRIQDQERFYAGLERNGPRAVEEFKNAF
jgi:hypothetical protein